MSVDARVGWFGGHAAAVAVKWQATFPLPFLYPFYLLLFFSWRLNRPRLPHWKTHRERVAAAFTREKREKVENVACKISYKIRRANVENVLGCYSIRDESRMSIWSDTCELVDGSGDIVVANHESSRDFVKSGVAILIISHSNPLDVTLYTSVTTIRRLIWLWYTADV